MKLFLPKNESINKSEISRIFWVASFFAIFAVVCVHIQMANKYMARTFSALACVAVPIFLIRSGYYLNYSDPPLKFWKKKLLNIIIPWIVVGTIIYINTLLFENNVGSFKGYLLYIAGYNTWIYFIPVLLICILLHRIFRGRVSAYVFIFLCIISNVLDYFGVNWLTNVTTEYFNFFNRIMYFSIGVLLKEHESVFKNKKLFLINLIIFVPLTIMFYTSDIAAVSIRIPFTLTAIGVIFYLSQFINPNKFILFVSKNTFLIFLFHMQFGYGCFSALTNVLHIDNMYFTFFLKPIIAFLGTTLLVFAFKLINMIPKIGKITWILGLKP